MMMTAFVACSCSTLDIDSPLDDDTTEQPGDGQDQDTDIDDGDDQQGNVGGGDAGYDKEQDGTGETDGYKLVWQDLFDGSSLDGSSWNMEVNGDGGGNAEMQYYRAENVSVGKDESGNGCLILTARRESYMGKYFTSGRVNTSGKHEFTHGKIEASIMIPSTANGLWPAFWLLGADYATNSWPRCGEIDIMEMGHADGIRNGTQDRYFNGAAHWGFYNSQSQYPNYAKSTTNSYSLQDGKYHLFTLEWDENFLRMYLDKDVYPDAAPYYEMGITSTNDEWGGTKPYFHHDFFIIFNLAVGGNFPGIHNAAQITAIPDNGDEAKMYVNFVRVYQK